jgi:hypothetical protein
MSPAKGDRDANPSCHVRPHRTVVLPSGFPVKPGVPLCFQLLGAPTGSVTVHGFLAKDK